MPQKIQVRIDLTPDGRSACDPVHVRMVLIDTAVDDCDAYPFPCTLPETYSSRLERRLKHIPPIPANTPSSGRECPLLGSNVGAGSYCVTVPGQCNDPSGEVLIQKQQLFRLERMRVEDFERRT